MDDPERALVPFSPSDDYVLLVNNKPCQRCRQWPGGDGEVIEVLRILTKLNDDQHAILIHILLISTNSQIVHFRDIPRNTRWRPRRHLLHLPRRTHYSLAGRRPPPPSNSGGSALYHARAIAPSWTPLSRLWVFFPKQRCSETRWRRSKMGEEGTAGLTAKLGQATYVTDTGNLLPDPGAMSLVFLNFSFISFTAGAMSIALIP
jgi:hypothetical protein